jgi:hypothetical protein
VLCRLRASLRTSTLASDYSQGGGASLLSPATLAASVPKKLRAWACCAPSTQFAEALLNLGHALMAMEQEEEARSYWRKAIREKQAGAQMYFEPPTA